MALQISMNALMTRHCVLMTTSGVSTCQEHIDVNAKMVIIVSMEFVMVNTYLYSSVYHNHSNMYVICSYMFMRGYQVIYFVF